MKTVLVVFGTRPEAIKMCPLILRLRQNDAFRTLVCVSGQHRELCSDVLDLFGIVPDYDLAVMRPEQSLSDLHAAVLTGVSSVLEQVRPDLVLVHGDTATALAAAQAAFYRQIPIGHVEAGLRTGRMDSPFPEEFNRRAITLMSAYHFAPTEQAQAHLLAEQIPSDRIFVTGNTVIDAVRLMAGRSSAHPWLSWFRDGEGVLLTMHRRENLGEPMQEVFLAVRRVCEQRPSVRLIYPVHPNPAVRSMAHEILDGCDNIRLCRPLELSDFYAFMRASHCILTDSGGVQEEASYLRVPVLVLRTVTERPEGIDAGSLRLAGIDGAAVYEQFLTLLQDDDAGRSVLEGDSPYGDGHASERIVTILENMTRLS